MLQYGNKGSWHLGGMAPQDAKTPCCYNAMCVSILGPFGVSAKFGPLELYSLDSPVPMTGFWQKLRWTCASQSTSWRRPESKKLLGHRYTCVMCVLIMFCGVSVVRSWLWVAWHTSRKCLAPLFKGHRTASPRLLSRQSLKVSEFWILLFSKYCRFDNERHKVQKKTATYASNHYDHIVIALPATL